MRSRERSKFESLIGAVAVWLETGEASKKIWGQRAVSL